MTISDVIVIRGAPGSGKSVTAKLLAARIGTGVRLEVDTLRSMVVDVEWTNQIQHIGTLSLAAKLVAGFLELGHRPVIVVDTFSGNKLTGFMDQLCSICQEVTVNLFALVPNHDALRSRVESRPEGQFKDLTICQRLNEDTLKYLQPDERVIDNSEMTPEETVRAILNATSKR